MISDPVNWTREHFRKRLESQRARELESAGTDDEFEELMMGGELPNCPRCGRRMPWDDMLRAHACPHEEDS